MTSLRLLDGVKEGEDEDEDVVVLEMKGVKVGVCGCPVGRLGGKRRVVVMQRGQRIHDIRAVGWVRMEGGLELRGKERGAPYEGGKIIKGEWKKKTWMRFRFRGNQDTKFP